MVAPPGAVSGKPGINTGQPSAPAVVYDRVAAPTVPYRRDVLRRRNEEIASLAANGWKLKDIAARYKISKRRVVAILQEFRPKKEDENGNDS